ncbi:MAG: protein translocase subunit SecF, partial [Sutterella wadsworthensis]
MEFFRIHKTIPFMHYRHVLNLISLVSFIVAVFWIFTH